ncbi:hypothetical protein [Kitasatospora sp. NPDC085464]
MRHGREHLLDTSRIHAAFVTDARTRTRTRTRTRGEGGGVLRHA